MHSYILKASSFQCFQIELSFILSYGRFTIVLWYLGSFYIASFLRCFHIFSGWVAMGTFICLGALWMLSCGVAFCCFLYILRRSCLGCFHVASFMLLMVLSYIELPGVLSSIPKVSCLGVLLPQVLLYTELLWVLSSGKLLHVFIYIQLP